MIVKVTWGIYFGNYNNMRFYILLNYYFSFSNDKIMASYHITSFNTLFIFYLAS